MQVSILLKIKTQDFNEKIKISWLKPEISPEISFGNNHIIHKPVF